MGSGIKAETTPKQASCLSGLEFSPYGRSQGEDVVEQLLSFLHTWMMWPALLESMRPMNSSSSLCNPTLRRSRTFKLSLCAAVFDCFTWVTTATSKWNHWRMLASIHRSCLPVWHPAFLKPCSCTLGFLMKPLIRFPFKTSNLHKALWQRKHMFATALSVHAQGGYQLPARFCSANSKMQWTRCCCCCVIKQHVKCVNRPLAQSHCRSLWLFFNPLCVLTVSTLLPTCVLLAAPELWD